MRNLLSIIIISICIANVMSVVCNTINAPATINVANPNAIYSTRANVAALRNYFDQVCEGECIQRLGKNMNDNDRLASCTANAAGNRYRAKAANGAVLAAQKHNPTETVANGGCKWHNVAKPHPGYRSRCWLGNDKVSAMYGGQPQFVAWANAGNCAGKSGDWHYTVPAHGLLGAALGAPIVRCATTCQVNLQACNAFDDAAKAASAVAIARGDHHTYRLVHTNDADRVRPCITGVNNDHIGVQQFCRRAITQNPLPVPAAPVIPAAVIPAAPVLVHHASSTSSTSSTGSDKSTALGRSEYYNWLYNDEVERKRYENEKQQNDMLPLGYIVVYMFMILMCLVWCVCATVVGCICGSGIGYFNQKINSQKAQQEAASYSEI